MDKLSKSEIKILTLLDNHVGDLSNKDATLNFLTGTLAFSIGEARQFYKLWYLNQEDEIPYKKMTNIIRDHSFVTQLLERISKADNAYEEVDKIYDENQKDYLKLLGPWWYSSCARYSSKIPCIEWEDDGIILNLDSFQWEEYFSGLGEDEVWRYKNATSYYNDDNEEFDNEEFEYAMYDDETINKFKQLAAMAGVDGYPGKGDAADIPTEETSDFLENILTPEEFDQVRSDYLWELGSVISRSRNQAVVDLYEEEVNYPIVSCSGGGDYCIKIPYEDLMVLVKDNDLINLSELKNAEVNGNIYLEDAYYDTWYDEEGKEEVIREFNNTLDRAIEKIKETDTDLEGRMKKVKNFNLYLKKLGFKSHGSWQGGPRWKNKDGNIVVSSKNYNVENNTLKFSYNDEEHIIPLEELIHWVQGSVLDLNESVRIGKYRLMMETIEQPENITKIAIFDFDGTLMKTPQPAEGKIEWKEKTGKEYPHRGWWSKRESLDTKIFDIDPIKDTVLEYLAEYEDPNTLVIMLTGRLPNQADQVEDILNSQGIIFDEYHYKNDGSTLSSKLNTIKSLLNRYPNVNFIEIYEDRESHAMEFDSWGKENNIDIKVNLVEENPMTHL